MAYYPYFPQNYGNAYNPNYTAGYQPFGQQPQVVQQQSAQPQVQQEQVGNVWVNDRANVDAYPVAPNCAVRLWSAREPVFWLKQADATGKPMVKTYDIVERTETPLTQESDKAYATKEDVGAVASALATALSEIEKLKAAIGNSAKGEQTHDA